MPPDCRIEVVVVASAILHASTDRHEMWDGPKRYVRVIVHDTTAEFQRAATAYRPETDFSDAAGCFHPAPDRERYVNGEWQTVTDPHWAGVLRLSREVLNSEVVTHECVHAGAAIYRMDVQTKIVLGYGCGEREEQLAYIVGDITASVSDALHLGGVW